MKKYLILLAGLFLAVSCKNYLDVQPQGMVLPSTDEEFASIIHTYLRDIEGGGDETIIGNMKVISDREGCADDLDANVKLGTNLVSYAGEIINQRQSEYRSNWSVIRDCNIVIENIRGRQSKTALGTLSAAYAIKAVCYYNMIRDYCEPWEEGHAADQMGLPIVDRFDIDEKPGRAPLDETAAYALSLFDKSLELSPQDPVFLFTEYVVKSYKARLLFWTEDWDGCAALCRDILDHCGQELTPRESYVEVMSSNAAKGEVLLKSHINNSSELDWYFSYIKNYIASRPANAQLIRLFGEEPQKDIRYAFSFDKRRFNLKPAEMRVRLSEMMLMEAECEYHAGHAESALDLVNQLRQNRIEGDCLLEMNDLPPVRPGEKIVVDACGKAITPLLQALLDERRKELYMEGDRWYELKRNGRPEWWVITNGLKYTTRKYLYTAPVYKGDVDMNPLMKQNPGYVY